jgi:hypothetical protein
MTRTLISLIGSLVAALALSAAASATTGPGGITAGAGCAVACIESALVTTTASSASVEVRTTVPTSVTVDVAKLDAKLGLAAGTAAKHASMPSFLKVRTVLIPGLEPEMTYRIVVNARDLAGKVQSRSGTFTTRAVKVAVGQPDLGLSGGLGCKADCLEQGALTSDGSVPGRARLTLLSSVPATFQVMLVAKTASGALLHQLGISTGSRKTEHAATLDGLLTGVTYAVTARATDAQGHTWLEQGTFRTRSAQVVVTFHKIKVLNDADKGANRGEIAFDYLAGDVVAWGNGFHRIGSGDTVAAKRSGTSRPGVSIAQSADGRRTLELRVGGVECDWQRLSKCPREASETPWPTDFNAVAKTSFDLRTAFLSSGALPPGYGIDLPAGHDVYLTFETTSNYLKFRVYATADVSLS